MPEQPQQRQITVNDIIHSDERVINLKKEYNGYLNQKNDLIIAVAHAESNIIYTMGAFEYLNAFTDTDDARADLLKKFMPYVIEKARLVKAIDEKDKLMEATTKRFEDLANSIVEDLKKAMEHPQAPTNQSAPESAPDPVPSTDICANCNYSKNYCRCAKECDCSQKKHQVCDKCQGCEKEPKIQCDVTVEAPTFTVKVDVQNNEPAPVEPPDDTVVGDIPGPEAN